MAGIIATPSAPRPPMMSIGPSKNPTVKATINPAITAADDSARIQYTILTIRRCSLAVQVAPP